MSENQEAITESANATEAETPQADRSRANRSQKVGTVASDKMEKTGGMMDKKDTMSKDGMSKDGMKK